jgi:hypothetical protein
LIKYLYIYIEESLSGYRSHQAENAVFGMPLEVAVALTKIDIDDLIPAVFKRCIEYLNDVGKLCFFIIVLVSYHYVIFLGVHEVGIYRYIIY